MKVSLSESALADLSSIATYYTEQGVADIGSGIIADLIRQIEMLRAHPDLGRVVPEFDTPSLREIIHPPFRIVYRRESNRVSVVRVWRGERLLKLP